MNDFTIVSVIDQPSVVPIPLPGNECTAIAHKTYVRRSTNI
jgi:hypothetical protein